MAKFELKFIDYTKDEDFIKVEKFNAEDKSVISINGYYSGRSFCLFFDKSTAIKFAKTLRTEINKITESEVCNEK